MTFILYPAQKKSVQPATPPTERPHALLGATSIKSTIYLWLTNLTGKINLVNYRTKNLIYLVRGMNIRAVNSFLSFQKWNCFLHSNYTSKFTQNILEENQKLVTKYEPNRFMTNIIAIFVSREPSRKSQECTRTLKLSWSTYNQSNSITLKNKSIWLIFRTHLNMNNCGWRRCQWTHFRTISIEKTQCTACSCFIKTEYRNTGLTSTFGRKIKTWKIKTMKRTIECCRTTYRI